MPYCSSTISDLNGKHVPSGDYLSSVRNESYHEFGRVGNQKKIDCKISRYYTQCLNFDSHKDVEYEEKCCRHFCVKETSTDYEIHFFHSRNYCQMENLVCILVDGVLLIEFALLFPYCFHRLACLQRILVQSPLDVLAEG